MNETMAATRTDPWRDWIPKLAQAGLAGDRQRLEVLVLNIIRASRRESPEVSEKLGSILAQYTSNVGNLRWQASGPPPTEAEEGLPLVRHLSHDAALEPILPTHVVEGVDQFLRERQDSEKLLAEGFAPPCSILLTGLPGTGKSMLAAWMAHTLQLPLLVQDLATSISSYLGKTGLNLRRTLDYARSHPCVLLLDEFDAIAKRRDDASEVGELKRIVNVLLKELENWPLHSVLIAATNHPELLDHAIRRRFDIVLELPMPSKPEREQILKRAAGRFAEEISSGLIEACAGALERASGSDLDTVMRAAVRKRLISNCPLPKCLISEVQHLMPRAEANKNMGRLVRALKRCSSEELTVRELAALFDRTPSTMQHHLKREDVDG